jgi:hypothetical protein
VRTAIFAAMLPVYALAQQAGIPTEWEVQKMVQAIAQQSARLQEMVDQVRPKDWVAKGAPEAYIQQWDSARVQAGGLKISSAALVQEPAKITASLDTFFRLQSLETSLTSLIDGVRRYQNPALADLLSSVLADSNASRQQLRQYVVDLAAIKEQEFKVMEQEAQRCRVNITRPQPPAPKKK